MRFHIQQESDIPASTQLYNQICFAIASRHYPPGHRLPSTRQLAMQTGLHRNTISKVYRQLETDGVVEAIAGSGIYVRDQIQKKEFKDTINSKKRNNKEPTKEAKKSIDQLIQLGCSLQESREILTNEIDWRIKWILMNKLLFAFFSISCDIIFLLNCSPILIICSISFVVPYKAPSGCFSGEERRP